MSLNIYYFKDGVSLNELHELKNQLLTQLEPPPNIVTLLKQYQFPILVYLKSVFWLEYLREVSSSLSFFQTSPPSPQLPALPPTVHTLKGVLKIKSKISTSVQKVQPFVCVLGGGLKWEYSFSPSEKGNVG